MTKKSNGKSQLNTLDSKHKSYVMQFDKNPEKVKKLTREKNTLESELNKINNLDFSEFTHDVIAKKAEILEKIKGIENEMSRINNNIDEAIYYNDAIDFLEPYYDKKHEKPKKKKIIKINKFFKKKSELHKSKNKKSQLYSDYIMVTENAPKKAPKKSRYKPHCCTNKICNNNELILHLREGYLVCTKCGERKDILLDSDKPNFKEPAPDSSAYAYKRINHLNESIMRPLYGLKFHKIDFCIICGLKR